MTYTLMVLPFEKTAFGKVISSETFDFHHGKHHQAYVTNLNNLIQNHEFDGKTLEEIIIASRNKPDMVAIFNNAAQVWNHNFFWNSLSPQNQQPSDKLLKMIEKDFSSLENFYTTFTQTAVSQFGSGWAWLVWNQGKLEIQKTSNAETPVGNQVIPLLTVDVWEHAYYLDYQNRRPDFVSTIIKQHWNWTFAEAQIQKHL